MPQVIIIIICTSICEFVSHSRIRCKMFSKGTIMGREVRWISARGCDEVIDWELTRTRTCTFDGVSGKG